MRISFGSRRALVWRFVLLLGISLALLIVDHRTPYLNGLRNAGHLILTPLFHLADAPLSFTRWMGTQLSSRRLLIEDNQQLQAELLLLKFRVLRYAALEKENQALRALLASAPKTEDRVLVAQLIHVSADPYIHQWVLDKGSRDQIYVGQPVIDAQGLVGQIITVNRWTSHVLLLTDVASAVPVEVLRNGVRAIAVGMSRGRQLRLLYLADRTDLRVGDELVTSGLGQRYPAGYPVGVVESIEHRSGEPFLTVLVKACANTHAARSVLFIWPHAKAIGARP